MERIGLDKAIPAIELKEMTLDTLRVTAVVTHHHAMSEMIRDIHRVTAVAITLKSVMRISITSNLAIQNVHAAVILRFHIRKKINERKVYNMRQSI